MGFASDTAVERQADGTYRAALTDNWAALHQLHGGYVAAVAARAVEDAVVERGAPPLRSATFSFLSGPRPGPTDVEVTIDRAGRSLVFSTVRVCQEGKPVLVGQTTHSPRWAGVDYSELVNPRGPVPGELPRFRSEANARHFQNADLRLDPDFAPFAGGGTSILAGWVRPLGDERVDATWLVMMGDIFPPAVFNRTTGPVPAFTVQYGIQVHVSDPATHVPEGGYVYARMHASHSSEGFAVEDGTVWAPDGTVLATCRQTRLAGDF